MLPLLLQVADQSSVSGWVVISIIALIILLFFGALISGPKVSYFPLLLLRAVLKPMAKWLSKGIKIIERRLDARRGIHADASSRRELESAMDAVHHHSSAGEIQMFKGIAKFSSTQVRQIMHPRTSIAGLDATLSYEEMITKVKESGYSRLPVYRESLDNIMGILYVKDLLEFLDGNSYLRWQDLIRPTYFVPETMKVDDLLKDIQNKRVHMAIVVDEYGGTAGMITLEDILEEVIGDIKDEYDEQDDIDFDKLDERNFVFEGKTFISDFCKILDIREEIFDTVRGDAESIGGLVLEMAGEIPEEGKELHFAYYTFTVLAVGNNRIEKVKVTLEEKVYEA